MYSSDSSIVIIDVSSPLRPSINAQHCLSDIEVVDELSLLSNIDTEVNSPGYPTSRQHDGGAGNIAEETTYTLTAKGPVPLRQQLSPSNSPPANIINSSAGKTSDSEATAPPQLRTRAAERRAANDACPVVLGNRKKAEYLRRRSEKQMRQRLAKASKQLSKNQQDGGHANATMKHRDSGAPSASYYSTENSKSKKPILSSKGSSQRGFSFFGLSRSKVSSNEPLETLSQPTTSGLERSHKYRNSTPPREPF